MISVSSLLIQPLKDDDGNFDVNKALSDLERPFRWAMEQYANDAFREDRDATGEMKAALREMIQPVIASDDVKKDVTAMSAPIHALVDAEAQSAMATARFIRLVGFTGDGDGMGELGDLQMARFRRRRRNTDGKDEDVEVEIPLLSMLPVPALQIRDAELEYTVRIIQTEAIQSQGDTKQSMMVTTPEGEPIATLRASFARDPRSDGRRTTDMLVKMKLRIEQDQALGPR